MSNEIQTKISRQSARRKLIRGVFAAPAVLTLSTGSALAATSMTQCVSYAATQGNQPGVNGGDTWVRVQQYSKAGADGTVNKYVSGSDIVALRGTKTSVGVYIGASQWQQLGSTALIEGSRFGGALPVVDTGKFVAVRIDTSGNLVGIVGAGSGGGAVAGTCWASFRASI